MSDGAHGGAAHEFVFRPRGRGRFVGIAFLALWSCLWAVAEALVLFVLGHGLWSLLTGSPAFGTGAPLRWAPALAVGAFLLVWLSIWTLGGVAAIQELLRLSWAEDRLALERDALVSRRRLGPHATTVRLPRSEIRSVFAQPATSVLMVQRGESLVALTDLGTPSERAEAGQRLRAALGLPDEDAAAELAALPADWEVVSGPAGERLLVRNRQTRRTQTVVLAIATAVVWAGLALLVREALIEPTLWVVTLMVAVLAAWLGWRSLWMLRGRHEWRLEPGRLIRQRRFGGAVTVIGHAEALTLTESLDSDGDAWYHLNASVVLPPDLPRAARAPRTIRITHAIHDDTDARCLGLWLARQTGVALHDRVPTETDRRAALAHLVEQLPTSSRFGRFVARLLGRVDHDGRG